MSRKSYGFTIVELLVVIVVIGILAAITVVSYTGISQKAKAASLQSDLSGASNQLKMYQVEHNAYPTSIGNDYCPTPSDVKYCLKASSGNSFDYANYTVNNASNPQTYNLKIINGSTSYFATDSTAPTATPPYIFFDDFNRANGAPGSDWWASTTPQTSAMQIVSNAFHFSGSWGAALASQPLNDLKMTFKAVSWDQTKFPMFLAIRTSALDTASNGYWIKFAYGAGLQVVNMPAGTIIADVSSTVASGDIISITVKGSNLTVTDNGTTVLSYGSLGAGAGSYWRIACASGFTIDDFKLELAP